MSSSGQDLWEVDESPPFVSVKEEGGFISKFAIYMYFKDLRRIITIKISIKLFLRWLIPLVVNAYNLS